MKEKFTDCSGCEWEFSHWRIPPEGHPLPAYYGKQQFKIPPEAIFTNGNGGELGVHPNNALVNDSKETYQKAGNKEKRRLRNLKRKRSR